MAILKTLYSLLTAYWDYLLVRVPALALLYRPCKPGIAFLVHPRDFTDFYRVFPAFRWLPDRWVNRFGVHIGPVTLNRMMVPNKKRVELHALMMTPEAMEAKANRKALFENLERLYILANRRNIQLVGLGAWLPYLTKYGKKYDELRTKLGSGPSITTGHALTGWCIRETLKEVVSVRHFGVSQVRVGIVGAAGSTGALTARMLAQTNRIGCARVGLHLLDQKSKVGKLESLATELDELGPVTASTEMKSLSDCEYIVVVTNAQSAIIKPEHVSAGTVILDDSQPRNTDPEVTEKAFVVDVLAEVSGLDAKFDFGFETWNSRVTFTCLAEAVLLGLTQHDGDFSFGDGVSVDTVTLLESYLEEAAEAGVDIRPAFWYSFAREMKEEQVDALAAPVSRTPMRKVAD